MEKLEQAIRQDERERVKNELHKAYPDNRPDLSKEMKGFAVDIIHKVGTIIDKLDSPGGEKG